MLPRVLGVAILVLGISAALTSRGQAAPPKFWDIETAKSFLEGELEGLAVDSEGRLRLSAVSRAEHDTETIMGAIVDLLPDEARERREPTIAELAATLPPGHTA